MNRLNWGILGTGNIARQFAVGVRASLRGRLAAVGSRSAESARTFAATHEIPASHATYDALLKDPNVNAVYNSLPNSMHHEWTIKALRAGKHVLCEKPFAINVAESEEMFDEAKRAGLIIMEAFMYRSHPLTLAVMNAVKSGAIGDVRLIRTSFCYRTLKIDDNIRFSPSLAGGALMDVGCYCVNFSRMVAGQEPQSVNAIAQKHPKGVDQILTATMEFPNGILASFTAGMNVQADNTAYICGSEGYIEIPIPWKPPMKQAAYTIARSAPPRMDNPATPAPPPRQTFHVDANMDLYGVEADDFAASVQDGTPVRVSREDTIGNMHTIERLTESYNLAK